MRSFVYCAVYRRAAECYFASICPQGTSISGRALDKRLAGCDSRHNLASKIFQRISPPANPRPKILHRNPKRPPKKSFNTYRNFHNLCKTDWWSRIQLFFTTCLSHWKICNSAYFGSNVFDRKNRSDQFYRRYHRS